MNLVVFGASGPTGLQVVRQALAAGHRVTAVARRPSADPPYAPNLDEVTADVNDRDAVERALLGAQAVISTIGARYGRHKITVYSNGTSNIMRAMAAHAIKRLVCVSSTTVAAGEAPGETLFWHKALIPLLRNVVGRTLYDDMERMEKLVQSSSLDWTIVRPAGLFDTAEPTHGYEVASQHLAGRYTSRADLAQTLLQEAVEPRHPRAIIEVITRPDKPPSARAFLKEAFGTKR